MPLMPLSMLQQEYLTVITQVSIMTYQQYYNKLIKEITEGQKHITNQNKLLKGDKGYFDKEDMYAYMRLQTELTGLLAKSEKVAKLITDGTVNATDHIDPSVLPDA
ncbi:MAG: hypothetical protein JSU01_07085 [Bacteroidetes bacterium]|nr:hypothetical protein [Bacteroidota bacterium]